MPKLWFLRFVGKADLKERGYHAILFHTDQSVYLEFGSIAGYDCVAVGSNQCFAQEKTKITKSDGARQVE